MKTNYLARIAFITLITVIASCSGIDINDEQAVVNDMQGTWIGSEHNGNIYRHIKLIISDNTFTGWYQITESADEPGWMVLPTESGTISLSSVLDISKESGKYRKINFFIRGRCCGDNSLTATIMSKMITYHEGKGLCVTDQKPMSRN